MGWTGRRLTPTLVAVLVLCVLVGGIAAFAIGRQQRTAAAPGRTVSGQASVVGTATSDTIGSGSSSASPAGTAPSDGTVPSAAMPPVSSSASGPASSSAGTVQPPQSPSQDVSVQLSPQALQSPHAEQVRQLLQRYFDAINTGDYDVWADAVSTAQSSSRPKQEWEKSYKSTHDSQIRVVSIFDDTLQVRLWFVSQQDVSLAPADLRVPCISWDVTYQLVKQKGSLVVGNSVPSAMNKVACS